MLSYRTIVVLGAAILLAGCPSADDITSGTTSGSGTTDNPGNGAGASTVVVTLHGVTASVVGNVIITGTGPSLTVPQSGTYTLPAGTYTWHAPVIPASSASAAGYTPYPADGQFTLNSGTSVSLDVYYRTGQPMQNLEIELTTDVPIAFDQNYVWHSGDEACARASLRLTGLVRATGIPLRPGESFAVDTTVDLTFKTSAPHFGPSPGPPSLTGLDDRLEIAGLYMIPGSVVSYQLYRASSTYSPRCTQATRAGGTYWLVAYGEINSEYIVEANSIGFGFLTVGMPGPIIARPGF